MTVDWGGRDRWWPLHLPPFPLRPQRDEGGFGTGLVVMFAVVGDFLTFAALCGGRA